MLLSLEELIQISKRIILISSSRDNSMPRDPRESFLSGDGVLSLSWAGEGLLASDGEGDLSTGDGDLLTGEGDLLTGEGDFCTGDGDLLSGEGDLLSGEGDLSTGDGLLLDTGEGD